MRNFTFDADKFVTACVRAWIGREPDGPRDDLHRAMFQGAANAIQSWFESGAAEADIRVCAFTIFETMRDHLPAHMRDAAEAVKAAAMAELGVWTAPAIAEVQ